MGHATPAVELEVNSSALACSVSRATLPGTGVSHSAAQPLGLADGRRPRERRSTLKGRLRRPARSPCFRGNKRNAQARGFGAAPPRLAEARGSARKTETAVTACLPIGLGEPAAGASRRWP